MIRQANAGKATALNAGIAATSAEIVAMVDADTVLEADTLRWLIEPFDDPNVGAVAGNTKVVNRDTLIGRWQHVEYVAGPNADRRIYDVLRCMPTVPGAVGAFRRQALDDIGGVSNDTLAEDTDLTMAIERAGWRVVYEDRAVAWTEVPADLRSLWRQRRRWTDGTMQAMWKHIRALTEPGAFGRRGLPYMAAYQLLWPLVSLSVDILAIHGLMVGPIFPACDPMIIVTVMQLGVTAYSLRLDRERIPVWQLPLHHFAQRIFMFALLACSLWALASRRPAGWQPTNRIGARQPVRSK
jgi:cellulose synthase/poly-beta-1,6-N-acetylglucosamine synthase-like glycosyltransferase